MGWFSNFKDDVLGLDPNGGGIYSVFDNVLGIDPNGGGIFTTLKSLGVNVTPQDLYNLLNQAISKGVEYIILDTTGLPVKVDINLFKNQNQFSGNNSINGTAANEVFDGREGNDTVFGWGGNDIINGGLGNDFLDGGEGRDTLDGGEGDDVLHGGSDNSFDIIRGGQGVDTAIYVGKRSDYVSVFNNDGKVSISAYRPGIGDTDDLFDVEKIQFADGSFTPDELKNLGAWFYGGAGNDVVTGRQGNDGIRGWEGNDSLYGDLGDDTLLGHSGDDVLRGDQGNDIINGEDGYDSVVLKGKSTEYKFDFSNPDRLIITDTVPNRDGQDTLIGAESIWFSDRDYRVSELKDFEQFYRLVHKGVDLYIQDGRLNSGVQHYELYGRNEGRETSTNFSEQFYRLVNPDVDIAIKEGRAPSALFHYLNWGYAEKRATNFNFDEKFYRLLHPDVDAAIKEGRSPSALFHYINYGYAEKRATNFNFDEKFYRLLHPDVDAAIKEGRTPSALFHYINYGYHEGRVTNISFDEQYYRNNNADVDAAIRNGTQISGLNHYINYGYSEKRIAKYNALNSNATLWGSRNSDIVEGSNGNNFIGGSDGNDTLIGGAGDDAFFGHTGNDSLDGGTGIDNAIYRGSFEDYHVVFYNNFVHVSDSVSNRSDTDTLVNVENLQFETSQSVYKTLSLSAIRDLGARFSGLEGDDVVTGGNGNDFYVRGNAGNDTLYGLLGDDTLFGNDGNDSLDGGDGNDFMEGGSGNDIYVVNAAGDVINETSTLITEIDTVQSAITYTLGANLENLTLTGTAVINGTGNALDNIIYGNTAGNIINGGAGNDFLNGQAGNDTLIGGLGNDIYIVDFVGDVVTETSALTTEVDTVRSSVSYTLGANVENLTLLGSVATNAIGNALNNVIAGNVLSNNLTGGAGVDTFVLSKTSVDTITDFAANEKLQISASAFGGGLNVGNLAANQILVGAGATAATTTAQRFIFNTTDKSLYFDVDGLNNASAVKIGVLSGVSTLSSANFSIGA